MLRPSNPYLVYMLFAAIEALAFNTIVTLSQVYQVEMVGLTALQLVLVGTALEVSYFLFEVPTGIVADLVSRRLSIILSMLIMGASMFVQAIPAFATVALGQAIWGFGGTFSSGALEAWASDELGAERAGQAFLRAAHLSQIGVVIGVLLGVALGAVRLNLPIQVGGALYIALSVFLILFMPERGFAPTPRAERTTWQAMSRTFREGLRIVRGQPVLLTLMVILFIHGASEEGFDRLYTKHLVDDFSLPAIGVVGTLGWFGLLRLGWAAITFGALGMVARRLDVQNQRALARALIAVSTVLIGLVVVFALTGNVALALAMALLIGPLRRLKDPLQKAWLNLQITDPQVRATILSMGGQMGSLGEIAGGPAIVAVTRGVRAAITAAGLLLTPALGLYARTLTSRLPLRNDEGDAR